MALFNRYQFEKDTNIWYNENALSFPYSDGSDAENYIHDSLKQCKDLSVHSQELLYFQKDWPSKYHFSSLRSNIIRPLKDTVFKDATVLELGCGCGAITRFLGESTKKTIAVEGSLKRASITAERCRDLNNVTVIADYIQNLPDEMGTFDVVTLIGVLEYSRIFGTGECPELELLKKAKSFLKPDGILILAIENKLGLKYFAGVPEDHKNIPWYGIMDLYSHDSVVTFSRKTLLKLLDEAGFKSSDQFVPIPDYKHPKAILHPAGLAVDEDIFSKAQLLLTLNQRSTHPLAYNYISSWTSICEAGLLHEMADSLCFVASNKKSDKNIWEKNILATHYGFLPNKKDAKTVQFIQNTDHISVDRKYIYPELTPPKNDTYQQTMENEKYFRGELLFERLLHTMLSPLWTVDQVTDILKPWHQWLLSQSIEDAGYLPTNLIEATPFNIIISKDNTLNYFDKEWTYKAILPVESMIYRSLFYTFLKIDMVGMPQKAFQLNFQQLIFAILQKFGYMVNNIFITKTIQHAFTLDALLGHRPYTEEELQAYMFNIDALSKIQLLRNSK